MIRTRVQLGVGLIRLGREWGHVQQQVPPESEALAFLEHAVELGIGYYDTAPSYGFSEERLGKFLGSLSAGTRNQLTIATKFGEHWDFPRWQPYVDHSFEALKRSLDQSIERLGRIDVLQLHKTTPAVLHSAGLRQAWEYAHSLGIGTLGASVSDLESAAAAIADPRYSCIQLPLNSTNRTFEGMVSTAADRGLFIAANRPYAMGAMLYGNAPASKSAAFRYILDRGFTGVILTGTGSIEHLDENLAAFREAAA